MGSLVLLMITGSKGCPLTRGDRDTTDLIADLHMQHDHKKALEVQDTFLSRLIKSYLFWISIAEIIGS
jgi:hypothetical protein